MIFFNVSTNSWPQCTNQEPNRPENDHQIWCLYSTSMIGPPPLLALCDRCGEHCQSRVSESLSRSCGMNRTEIHQSLLISNWPKGNCLFVKTLPKTQRTWERNAFAEVIPKQCIKADYKLWPNKFDLSPNCESAVTELSLLHSTIPTSISATFEWASSSTRVTSIKSTKQQLVLQSINPQSSLSCGFHEDSILLGNWMQNGLFLCPGIFNTTVHWNFIGAHALGKAPFLNVLFPYGHWAWGL